MRRSSPESGYEADISDCSSQGFKNANSQKQKYMKLSADALISTHGVTIPEQGKLTRAARNVGIRELWNNHVKAKFPEAPEASLLSPTDNYIDYLGRKLNALFWKFTSKNSPPPGRGINFSLLPGVPVINSIVYIFSRMKMDNLLDVYFDSILSGKKFSKKNTLIRKTWRTISWRYLKYWKKILKASARTNQSLPPIKMENMMTPRFTTIMNFNGLSSTQSVSCNCQLFIHLLDQTIKLLIICLLG